MTLAAKIPKIVHDCDGIQRVWSYDFDVLVSTDLSVYVTALIGDPVKVSTGFSINLNDHQVTYPIDPEVAPLPVGYKITIARELDYTQPIDFTINGQLNLEVLEDAHDRCVMLVQQVKEIVDRCLKYAIDHSVSSEDITEYVAACSAILASAIAARDAALAAVTAAQASATSAATAQGLAETARSGAETASSNAVTARNQAVSARNDAIAARDIIYAYESEKFAIIENVDVSTSTYIPLHPTAKEQLVFIYSSLYDVTCSDAPFGINQYWKDATKVTLMKMDSEHRVAFTHAEDLNCVMQNGDANLIGRGESITYQHIPTIEGDQTLPRGRWVEISRNCQ